MTFDKRFAKFYLLVLLFFFLVGMNLSFAGEINDISKNLVYKTVSEFCNLEFEHNFDRDKLIKMSSSYKNKIDKLTGSVETLYIPDAYEIYAIKSYKILDLTVNGNKAIATVSYDVLAKRTGWKQHERNHIHWGEAIFVEYLKPNYIAKIHLTYDGKRWWILDPPSPKISVDEIINFFEAQMTRLAKHHPEVKTGTSWMGAQDLYNADQRNLTLLKKLARE